MNTSLRILSAAAISLAAFGAHAGTGDDSFYPMGTAATAPAGGTPTGAAYTEPYVWTSGEAGLIMNNAPSPTATRMQPSAGDMPTVHAHRAAPRATDRPALFLGA